jgi:Cu+-exporting ATPase
MPDTLIADKQVCYHCGDLCKQETIRFREKVFCCEGCKTVFEILDQNGLCKYYDLEKHPGFSVKKPPAKDVFAYLDDESIKNQLLDYRSNKLEKVTFRVPQVHCASCIWLLENLYKLTGGISESKVNFIRKEIYISYDPQIISLRQVVELLASIGYQPDISLYDAEHKKPRKDRSLLYKLGIAGFAFGNVMLFSFPEYLGLDELYESGFRKYFAYWNLLLSLPVFIYSARGYLTSAWNSVTNKQLHLDIPIALGIIALFGRSAYEIITGTGSGYTDSFTGLIFFMLTGKWFQSRTYEQLSFERDYKSYFPVAVTKITDNAEQSVPVSKIEVGDTIKIRHGEIIPADGILLGGDAFIDYSFVTGESKPVKCEQGELIYAGGKQTGAAITLSVTKKVSQSYLTRLWNHESFQKKTNGKLTSLSDRLSRWFTPLILIIGFAAAVYWISHDGWGKGAWVFTAVLIVACPCALALSGPFTLGNAMRILGRHGFYVKNTLAIESITMTDSIVFDKTGTLTLSAESEIEYMGVPLDKEEAQYIHVLASQSSHPISQLIARYVETLPFNQQPTISPVTVQLADFEEITGQGIQATINRHKVKIGSENFVMDKSGDNVSQSVSSSNRDIEYSKTFISIDGKKTGYFLFKPRYRAGLANVIKQLKNKYSLSLISGDKDTEKQSLQEKFGSDVPLHFNQSPFEKLQFIQSLQLQKRHVMMIGDGLNDAGALQQSDIGMAVSDNVNNFSPACDAIIDGRQFAKLPAFLDYCTTSVILVKTAFGISLLYNIAGISVAVMGLLSPLFAAVIMPLSSVSVVLFGTISTYMYSRILK